MFLIFTFDKIKTFEVSRLESSITLALEIITLNLAILVSNNPCASLAASYSAFSDKSPLSIASPICCIIKVFQPFQMFMHRLSTFVSLLLYNNLVVT